MGYETTSDRQGRRVTRSLYGLRDESTGSHHMAKAPRIDSRVRKGSALCSTHRLLSALTILLPGRSSFSPFSPLLPLLPLLPLPPFIPALGSCSPSHGTCSCSRHTAHVLSTLLITAPRPRKLPCKQDRKPASYITPKSLTLDWRDDRHSLDGFQQ